MTVIAHLVGGPLDGQVTAIERAEFELRFPIPPRRDRGYFATDSLPRPTEHRTLYYRRRLRPRDTGQWCYDHVP